MIRHLGPRKYGLYSIKTHKRLGLFTSLAAAKTREKQIHYFKFIKLKGGLN
jgi:hypothetical protein